MATTALAPVSPFDPTLDLRLVRTADVPVEKVWRAWTEPELIKQWFTPAPWKTIHSEVDLRPGGIFSNTMLSPEGQEFPNVGSYLEVVPHKRLVWTACLRPGFRPQRTTVLGEILFTAVLEFEKTETGGTQYTATVMHSNPEDMKKHEEMGFEHGWGAVWLQLVELIQSGKVA